MLIHGASEGQLGERAFPGPVIAVPGNGRPRKIERKTVSIEYDLDHVRIKSFSRVVYFFAERAHRDRWIIQKWGDSLIDHLRMDERLISLHIHDDVAVELIRNLCDPVRTCKVSR